MNFKPDRSVKVGEPLQGENNVRVCVRIRPINESSARKCIQSVPNAKAVILNCQADGNRTFTYDYVADENTTQEEVFQEVGIAMADACIAGFNSTTFAYGQTSSGKTYTILGPMEDEGEPLSRSYGPTTPSRNNGSRASSFLSQSLALNGLQGLIPRVFNYLFSVMRKKTQENLGKVSYTVKFSMLEIYNEQITDLLDPSSTCLQIREDTKRGVYVEGLKEESVFNADTAFTLLRQGNENRRVGATAMNAQSSRSHSVLTLVVESKEEKENSLATHRYSRLSLIDLAGSERQKSTDAVGLRLKEAGNINRSLSALGNVIRSLVDVANGKPRHIHYRDSKLTFLLKDSLGGNSKTYIVATVSPLESNWPETLSTLQFAQRAKLIKNVAVVNEDLSGSVLELQKEVRKLKDELNLKNNASQGFRFTTLNNAYTAGDEMGDRIHQLEVLLSQTMDIDEEGQKKLAKSKDKVAGLESLIAKKDHFLLQTKMVLRLRESEIARLQQVVTRKEIPQVFQKDQEQQIKMLKDEILCLKNMIDHHPDVTKYAMENLHLRDRLIRVTLSGDDRNRMEEEKETLKNHVRELSDQCRQLIQDKHELEESLKTKKAPPTFTTPTKGQSVPVISSSPSLGKWKNQQQFESQIEILRSELEKERSLRLQEQASFTTQKIVFQSQIESLVHSIKDYEDSFRMSSVSHEQELNRVRESHQGVLRLVEEAHANEIHNLKDHANKYSNIDVIKSGKIVALENELEMVIEKCEKMSFDLMERDEDIRNLRTELAQSQAASRRLSEVFSQTSIAQQKMGFNITDSDDNQPSPQRKGLKRNLEDDVSTDNNKEKEVQLEKEIQQLKENYQQQIVSLNSQVQALSSDLSDRETRIDQMNEEYADLEDKQTESLEKNKQLKISFEIEVAKVRELETQLRLREQAIQNLQEQIDSLTFMKSTQTAEGEMINQQLLLAKDEIFKLRESQEIALQKYNVAEQELRTQLSSINQMLAKEETEKNNHALKISELQERIENYSQEKVDLIAQHQSEIAHFSAELQTKHDAVISLNTQLENLQRGKQIDMARFEELQMRLSNIEIENNTLLFENTKSKEQNQQEIERLSSEVNTLQTEKTKLLQEKQSDITKLSEMQQRLEHASQEGQSLYVTYKQFERERNDTEIQHQNEVSNLTSQLNVQLNKVQNLVAQIEQLQTEKMNECQKVSELQNKLSEIEIHHQNQIANLSTEIHHQLNNVQELHIHIDQLQSEKVRERERASELQNKLSEIETQYQNQVQMLHAQISALENEKIVLTQKVVELKEKLASMQLEIQTQNDVIQSLTTRLEESSNNVTTQTNELRQKLNELQEENCTLQSKVETHISLAFSLYSQIDEIDRDRNSVLASMETLKIHISDLENEKSLQHATHIQESEELNGKLSVLQNQVSEATIQIAKLREELSIEKENGAKLSLELEAEKREFSEVQKQLLDVRDEHAKLIGHNNPKQKIQHHIKIKEENNTLRESITLKDKEIFKLNRTVEKLRKRDSSKIDDSLDSLDHTENECESSKSLKITDTNLNKENFYPTNY